MFYFSAGFQFLTPCADVFGSEKDRRLPVFLLYQGKQFVNKEEVMQEEVTLSAPSPPNAARGDFVARRGTFFRVEG